MLKTQNATLNKRCRRFTCRMPSAVCGLIITLLTLPPNTSAQPGVAPYSIPLDPPWTQHLIKNEDRDYNFKTVARGARTEHLFVLKNKFEDDVHIAGIAVSCTCTDVAILDNKTELQTYEEAKIVARFRTDLFEGPKNATITVTLDKPYPAVIQLNVRGEIRSDVSVAPANINFGNVKEGSEVSRTIDVVYTGSNAAWKILDFKCNNEHLAAEVESVESRPGKITSKIRITQDAQAPQGQYSDYVVLLTNDEADRREIPMLVQGTVGAMITVTPRPVFLGFLKPGEPSGTKIAVLRGTQPFRITAIHCENPAVEILFEPKDNASALTFYRIPIKYTNPAKGEGSPKDGKLRAVVNVQTDQAGLSPVINVTAEKAAE